MSATDVDLAEEERKAIASLKRLAARWPRTLTLMSMSGTLVVVRSDDGRLNAEGPVRGESVIDTVHGIPNDGGDW